MDIAGYRCKILFFFGQGKIQKPSHADISPIKALFLDLSLVIVLRMTLWSLIFGLEQWRLPSSVSYCPSEIMNDSYLILTKRWQLNVRTIER